MALTGKTAVITGGGSGIGAATAAPFVEAGARVVIAGRREASLRAVADAAGGEPAILCQPTDVAHIVMFETDCMRNSSHDKEITDNIEKQGRTANSLNTSHQFEL